MKMEANEKSSFSMELTTTESIFDSNMELSPLIYNYTFCGEKYESFGLRLTPIILNLNLIICLCGICANILNVFVFSRRNMKSAINLILLGIAISDIVVMLAFMPEYISKTRFTKGNGSQEYAAAIIWIAHEYFLNVFHPISVWLTTTMAIWRYIAVVYPLKCRTLCTMKRAKIIICVIFLFNIFITIPGYVAAYVAEGDETKTWKEGGCGAKYCAKWKDFNVLRKIEFLYHGFAGKILTSIIMTFVSIRLIFALIKAHKERRKLTAGATIKLSSNANSNAEANNNNENNNNISNNNNENNNISNNNNNEHKSTKDASQAEMESNREFDRMTRMILVVLLIFLTTELPPSVLYILEVFYGPSFYFECRRPVHYLIFTLYLLSGTFNFLVYLSMSRNFRNTLFQHFGIKPKTLSPVNSSSNATNGTASSNV